MIFGIPWREGMICGIAVHDNYVKEKISRVSWALGPLPPEEALIEDMVLFQIITSPGIKTRTLLRLAPSVNAFLKTMTLEQTQRELLHAVHRLERRGRIHQPKPNRWALTHAGRVAAWAELPMAWKVFVAHGKRPPEVKSIR